MKNQATLKIAWLLFTLNLLISTLYAQAPQKMSYQAVIRNSTNALVSDKQVGMRISVLKGSATGLAVYVETQTPSTNANGLVSLEIGSGIPITGTFAGIDWANGPYYIKTETDLTGGYDYTLAGKSQLLSVPYALFSANGTPGSVGPKGDTGPQGPIGLTGPQGIQGIKGDSGARGLNGPQGIQGIKGDSGARGLTGPQGIQGMKGDSGARGLPGQAGTNAGVGGFTHYLGEAYLGGRIFYLYKGSDSLEHGLVVALTESSTNITWQTTSALVNANRSEDGVYNTNLMTGSPAKTYISTLGAGWYLPSIDELALLYYNRFTVQKALRTGSNTLLSITAYYWSSTEYDALNAFYFGFTYGNSSLSNKTGAYTVRGIRAF